MAGRRILVLSAALAAALLLCAHRIAPLPVQRTSLRTVQSEAAVAGETEALRHGGTVSKVSLEVDASERPQPVEHTSSVVSLLPERTMQCPTYAGPMYLPYSHPKPVPRRPVRVAALPQALNEQPLGSSASRTPLIPFSLDSVRIEPRSRFGIAQQTNSAFLRMLDPDRLLFFFRRLANVQQPRPTLSPYGGWESQGSGLRGEFTGHYLHAAAAVAASGDELLASRCELVVDALHECQEAMEDGYLSAFPQTEFASVESMASRSPWVPYYVMHKLLVGLMSVHELLGSARALVVATRLAEHLRGRVLRLLAKGLDVWQDFINQEVGGMSEALADLARLTRNESWLQLAAMFERPCFLGTLARGGASEAMERVHANTHLPQLLGTMARYEGTGDETLRGAAEAFWSELSSRHTFVTGSSTAGEVWLRAGEQANAIMPQGKDNYWAHGTPARAPPLHGKVVACVAPSPCCWVIPILTHAPGPPHRPSRDVRRAQQHAHLAPAAAVESLGRVGARA